MKYITVTLRFGIKDESPVTQRTMNDMGKKIEEAVEQHMGEALHDMDFEQEYEVFDENGAEAELPVGKW